MEDSNTVRAERVQILWKTRTLSELMKKAHLLGLLVNDLMEVYRD